MVFMVRLISGSLLFLLCIVQVLKATEPTSKEENQQTFSIERTTKKSLLKDVNKVREITDEDVENIVKPFKFSSTNVENVTSIKLQKSESYTSTQEPTYGSSRIENGRSVDIDIEKYISPDFYNAVYTPPISTNTKDYSSDHDSHAQYGTEGSSSFENFGQLTTPRTPYFDKKYKEMVESVNQKLEVETDIENLTHPPNYTSDNFIEDLDKSPNGTKVVYKIFENIGMNESEKAGGGHRDMVLETQTILSFERLRNETTTYDERTPREGINELHKENMKYLLGEENSNEVKKQEDSIRHPPFLRTSFQLTTRKYGITKPPTDKNDAGIISNKIESDNLKSLTTSTTVQNSDNAQPMNSKIHSPESKTRKRGSMKFVDYQKVSSSTVPTYENVPEQIYLENQVIPVHVASPATNVQTTSSRNETINEQADITYSMHTEEETTIRNENISVRNNTIEPEEQQSTTVLIIVQHGEPRNATTESNSAKETTVTIASTPRGFSLPIQYEANLPTTELTKMTTEAEESTTLVSRTEFEVTSTTEELATTKLNDIITERRYPTDEVTSRDMTTFHSETLQPSTVEATVSSKHITMLSTGIENPSTNPLITDSSSTSFPSTKEPLIPKDFTRDLELSTLKSSMSTVQADEETTTDSIERTTVELDVTTQDELKLSEDVNVIEELSATTKHLKDITSETSHETTTLTESSSGIDLLIEATTNVEPRSSVGIQAQTSSEMTGESTTQLSISTLTADQRTTTETTQIATVKTQQTTVNELRFSKGMKFTEATEIMKDSTAETAFETSTLIGNETLAPSRMDKTKMVEQHQTTTAVPTDSQSEIMVEKVLKATPIENLLDNKNNTQHDNGTSGNIAGKNHTTLFADKLNKMYSTTPTPTEYKTSKEPITIEDGDHSSDIDGPSGTIVAIVISCVGGVCLIALACLLIVMRNRQNRFNYGQRCKPVSMDQYSVDSVSVFSSVRRKGLMRDSKRSYGNPAFDDPVCMSHPLNFPAISKFSANHDDVHAEFGDIPQIVARTSELPEGCETKNRFANVIPLPESRVFLTRMAGYHNSDYINANYVTGPKNIRKYYIACQAPMSNTVDDFWRMIWEQQCKVILMLTHLFENGSEKCFDYLPPSEVLDCHRLFGDYQVTLKKREVKEKYIISSIQLKNMVSNSWREVTHFWYMGWPEKGVPAEANSIIAFLIEARSYMKSGTMDKKLNIEDGMNGSTSMEVSPVVVHCSPGTGRTGTVITCDIAIREFEQTRQVDIPKIVYRIRRDRASAVQTKEQYAFIYKVIALYATKLAGGILESI